MKECYLNGTFVPIDNAQVSVLDRGFLFSDAVYEVIPIYNNVPFLITEHIDRLRKSLDALKISTDFPLKASAIINQLLEKKPLQDSYIYIQISRGAAESRSHQLQHHIEPTVFVTIMPVKKTKHQPCSIITHEEIRWKNCWIKSTSLLGNIMGMQAAQEQHAQECIFHNNGWITEGSSSNIFIIQDDQIKTPPLSKQILGGITREAVIEISNNIDIPLQEAPISIPDLLGAQVRFITSSTRGISPVSAINQQKQHTEHPLLTELQKMYDEHINQTTLSY